MIFFYIPTDLIMLLTFPGVILHEVSHRVVCDLLGVRVLKVAYFIPFSDVLGFVMHEKTSTKNSAYIAFAPFFFNSIACMLFCLPAAVNFFISEEASTQFSFVCLWLGLSFGIHAFPSNQDVEGLNKDSENNELTFFYKIARYVVLVLNFFTNIYFNLLFAGIIGFGIPYLLLG